MIPEIEATVHDGIKGNQPFSQVDIDLATIEPTKEIFDETMQQEIIDKLVSTLSEHVGEDRAEGGTLTVVNLQSVRPGASPHIRRYRLSAAPQF